MSYHFYIPKNKGITAGELLEEVRKDIPQAELENAENADSPAGQGVVYLRYGYSSRGAFVTSDEKDYDVTSNTWSSKEDYELALSLTRALSRLNGATITPEDRDAMSLEAFEADFDEAWTEQAKHWGLRAIAAMVQRDNGTMTMYGCYRAVHIGPWMVSELFAGEPDDETLYARAMERIRAIQYIDPDETYVPSLMRVNAPNDKHITYIVWLAEAPELLHKSDYVLIHHDDNLNTLVPRDEIIELMGPRSERLDEEQYLMPPVPVAEFVEIATRLMQKHGDARSAIDRAVAKAGAEGEAASESATPAESPAVEEEAAPEAPAKKKPKWKFW